MRKLLYLSLASSLLIGATGVKAADVISEEELMKTLTGAAPANVLKDATIMNKDENGDMKVIRKGTNSWTCMDPGGEPMCADEAAMKWVDAWVNKKPVPETPGFVYMLKGDHGASNTDPYAKGKTDDNYWVQTGPHVMIVGPSKAMADGFPQDKKADPTKPYVMWAGTPYQHLMLPLE